MDKSIEITRIPNHSPRFKPWAIYVEMAKPIERYYLSYHSP
jgi:hypothetical protein